jgi:thiosulfate reductase/polysulfide reductase chain A
MASRRDFIKITSVGGAGMMVAGNAAAKYFDPAKNMKGPVIQRTPTYCEVCFWKCAGWAHTDVDGNLWKVEGNKKDPLCNGRLCPRGTGGIGMYNDPDRLKYPMIRVEERGKQVFKEVSWHKALEFVAKKMKALKEEHGAESLALFNHGSGGKHFSTLVKAFGSETIVAPSYAQCRGPRETAWISTFGTAVNSPEPTDIKNTNCLVLIGSHIGENMHNSQVQEMSQAIDRKAIIITVDPRLSTAASHSKYWLPIKPSTDIALLLAWIHVIIYEKRYNPEHIEKNTFGFEELKEHVAEYTPEWAAKITDLKADQIRETAREMAFHAPSTIVHPGRHVTWYGDDVQRIRCVAILNGLMGSFGAKGGFYLPGKATVPSFPHPPFPKPDWSWKDYLDGKYPLAGINVSNAMIDASHPDNQSDKKVKGWIVVGTNLINTIPDTKRTIEALKNQDLVVVVDTMPMEITGWADVILPECTYLERYDDLRVAPDRQPTVALRMPAVKPKYLTKPASWIVRRLALKLGLQAYFNYKDFSEVIDWQLKQMGSGLAEMKKTGILKFPRPESSLYFPEGEAVKLKTASGKIELYSQQLEEKGFDPMPKFTAHPQAPDGFYRLNYGRAPMHTFSRTANNANLTDIMAENKLWVNPMVAEKYGLTMGQYIWLENQDGVVSEFAIKVRVTERIGPSCVYMVHGFGHANKMLKRCFGKGVSDTQLITNVVVDPIMGGTGMRGNFVKFITEEPVKEVES